MASENLLHVVLGHVRAQPQAPCLRFHRNGAWRDLTWGDFGCRVEATGAGLARLGVQPGERTAIVSANRPEWALADLGSLAAAAVPVTVYPTLTPDETAYILGHSSARVAFVENRDQLAKVESVRGRLPMLRHLVLLEGEGDDASGAWSLRAVEEAGSSQRDGPRLTQALAAHRDTPLTVVYTSGTTGVPKGVVLTHGNVLGVIEAVLAALGAHEHLRVNLSFLPLAHALERLAGHFLPLYLGRTIAYARSLDTVAEDFLAVRPDFAVAVPRVFEKVSARILGEVARRPPPVRILFRWALTAGERRSELEEQGQSVSAGLRVRHALADRLVLGKIRGRFGGRLRMFVCGGAPLAADVARFFHACGILVCEGWGATETAAPSTWNTPAAFRFGSVGRALPGVEVAVAEDGELLVRGPNVFPGYLDDVEATAEALDAGGFWHSGDIGTVDADGFFHVTDRKKELVILASGKNIAPSKIENLLRRQPSISNCMVHGDRRPCLVALVTVDRAALAARRAELASVGIDDLRLHDAVAADIAAVNAGLARFEQVKRFAIVEPDFTPEGGELTLTLKLKRRIIASRHAAALERLYEEKR